MKILLTCILFASATLSRNALASSQREVWLANVLGAGELLLSGNYSDQSLVNQLDQNSFHLSLVSANPSRTGLQSLFAAYLIDVESGARALSFLGRSDDLGRDAVEELFRTQLNSPLNFDAIFSNFLTYVFQASVNQTRLPLTWSHDTGSGLTVNAIVPQAEIQSLPTALTGSLAPYSFALIHLDYELPQTAVVNVNVLGGTPCAEGNSILWKPVNANTLAIYSTGCEQQSGNDAILFRLVISEAP